jgi:hypothetical protein
MTRAPGSELEFPIRTAASRDLMNVTGEPDGPRSRLLRILIR